MNVSPEAIEAAIGPRTKALLIMHYAGAACAMEPILEIVRRHQLILIEDAAHCIGASYRGQPLGTFGDIGTLSFHETKNIQCGEGGALILNRSDWVDRARQIREKGTNRPAFDRGAVSFYEWTEVGSSYLLGEMAAAFLYGQLVDLEKVSVVRRKLYVAYQEALRDLAEAGHLELPQFAEGALANGHIAYIKVGDRQIRDALAGYLRERGISAYFHYVPLHLSAGGKKFGRFHGEDRYTSRESGRLLRLPLYPGLEATDFDRIIAALRAFFGD
jgi:dTDP-4-amino-4,6-dideoxygalactose transaminase